MNTSFQGSNCQSNKLLSKLVYLSWCFLWLSVCLEFAPFLCWLNQILNFTVMSDNLHVFYSLRTTKENSTGQTFMVAFLTLNFSSNQLHCGRHRHFSSCKVLWVMKSLKLPWLIRESRSTLISPRYTCHNCSCVRHCEESLGICDYLNWELHSV